MNDTVPTSAPGEDPSSDALRRLVKAMQPPTTPAAVYCSPS